MAQRTAEGTKMQFVNHPEHHKLVTAYCNMHFMEKASFMRDRIREFFNSMNNDQRRKLLDHYEHMTPEQRKFPSHVSKL